MSFKQHFLNFTYIEVKEFGKKDLCLQKTAKNNLSQDIESFTLSKSHNHGQLVQSSALCFMFDAGEAQHGRLNLDLKVL